MSRVTSVPSADSRKRLTPAVPWFVMWPALALTVGWRLGTAGAIGLAVAYWVVDSMIKERLAEDRWHREPRLWRFQLRFTTPFAEAVVTKHGLPWRPERFGKKQFLLKEVKIEEFPARYRVHRWLVGEGEESDDSFYSWFDVPRYRPFADHLWSLDAMQLFEDHVDCSWHLTLRGAPPCPVRCTHATPACSRSRRSTAEATRSRSKSSSRSRLTWLFSIGNLAPGRSTVGSAVTRGLAARTLTGGTGSGTCLGTRGERDHCPLGRTLWMKPMNGRTSGTTHTPSGVRNAVRSLAVCRWISSSAVTRL